MRRDVLKAEAFKKKECEVYERIVINMTQIKATMDGNRGGIYHEAYARLCLET